MKENESFLNHQNVRSEHQKEIYDEIERTGECPFCGDNLKKYNDQEFLRKGDYWTLLPSQWPYDNTSVHLLAIPHSHVETLNDIKDDAFNELLAHLKWAENEFGIQSGGIAMRFGDVAGNGASVSHLHMHLIVPSPDKPADVKVKFKIS